jgi:hypothetical protein
MQILNSNIIANEIVDNDVASTLVIDLHNNPPDKAFEHILIYQEFIDKYSDQISLIRVYNTVEKIFKKIYSIVRLEIRIKDGYDEIEFELCYNDFFRTISDKKGLHLFLRDESWDIHLNGQNIVQHIYYEWIGVLLKWLNRHNNFKIRIELYYNEQDQMKERKKKSKEWEERREAVKLSLKNVTIAKGYLVAICIFSSWTRRLARVISVPNAQQNSYVVIDVKSDLSNSAKDVSFINKEDIIAIIDPSESNVKTKQEYLQIIEENLMRKFVLYRRSEYLW